MTVMNDTPLLDGLALGMGPDRKTHAAVVLKATFQIPRGVDGEVVLADAQRPILDADEFFDGDVTGSVYAESERYVYKPRADVLVVGSAWAPGATSATEVNVALRVGEHQWAMRVVGDRRWVFPTRAMLTPVQTSPTPFQSMPLRWERAFGGMDHRAGEWFARNPVGRGLVASKTRESADGTALPNLEAHGAPITMWDDAPPPVGLAPVRKDWAPRSALSGRRLDALHPVFGLPEDFDHAYFNGAPAALQVPFLQGGEVVEMQHLTPDRFRRFRLPGWQPRVTLGLFTDGLTWDEAIAASPDALPDRPTAGAPLEVRLDTLALYPDEGVFTLTWRANRIVAGLELDELAGYAVDLKRPGA